MNTASLKSMQTDHPDEGTLQLYVLSSIRSQPVEDASVQISYTGDPDSVIEEVKTDANGMIPEIQLPAPPLEYSMAPSEFKELSYLLKPLPELLKILSFLLIPSMENILKKFPKTKSSLWIRQGKSF